MTSGEEKYARAIRAGRLQIRDEGPHALGTIIAAGTADSLGVLLTRLRIEWDSVSRRDLRLGIQSDEARVSVALSLRSLEPSRRALLGFAVRQAPHKSCDSTPAELGKLVGQVLDIWLDKLCHPCEGRGFSGGYGSPRLMCGKCGGTGSRRNSRLGANAAERAFGLWLLCVLDSRCAAAMKQVQRKTRQG